MAGVNFDITVVHKNGTCVYNIQTTGAKFQELLSLVQTGGSDVGVIAKVSGSAGTGNEVGFSLTEGGNAVDLDASINATVGGNDTTIYALYLELETITGFYLDGTKYKIGGDEAAWGNISGTLSDQTDLNTALTAKANASDVLTKTNTTAFTPSGDYNPATKKYVDDNVVQKSATAPSSPTEGMVWYDTTNDQLKVYDGTNWNVTGKEYNAGGGIEIGTYKNYSAMQGPCPDGFHIPSFEEISSFVNIIKSIDSSIYDDTIVFSETLKIPMYPYIDPSDGVSYGGLSLYLTAEPKKVLILQPGSSVILFYDNNIQTCFGGLIRPFKNTPVMPNSSWSTIRQINGVGGIYHNESFGLISISLNGESWITIADKNLGATEIRDEAPEKWTAEYMPKQKIGNIYQRGNNYGFEYNSQLTTSATQIDASGYGPGNYYSSSTFITGQDWFSVKNDNLWGGETGVVTIEDSIINTGVLSVNGQTGNIVCKYNAWKGISIGDILINGRRGPSPDGFHVPLTSEWDGLITIMNGLSLTTGDSWRINLHMPFAGARDFYAVVSSQGTYGNYWSSSPYSTYSTASDAWYLRINSSNVNGNHDGARGSAYSIRCFKDAYVTPDSTWTVVQGTLGSAGIFWNQSEGLISITDGSTGYTIMDKNLGATTVYNDGDTLTQDNMGNMYQWGNNYGFPSTGTISKTSPTHIDASGYGPTNPYSSDTFITGGNGWTLDNNEDLWGYITGTIRQNNAITNTGVLSVNGQTGNISNVVTGDAQYVINVSTTAPSSGTASNIITIVTGVTYKTASELKSTFDTSNYTGALAELNQDAEGYYNFLNGRNEIKYASGNVGYYIAVSNSYISIGGRYLGYDANAKSWNKYPSTNPDSP